MTFRPYPGVTIAAAIAFAILVGLGVWQLHRLQWKLALIAEVNAHMAQAPIGFARARALGADAQYRHVALDGRFDHAHEAYVFTTGEGGAAVYHVLTPLITADGALLVDRGMVPKEKLDPAKLKAAIDFAISAERKYPPDLAKVADIRDLRVSVPLKYAGEAFSSPIGPLKAHAPANGIIIRHGYIVAEWGRTQDVDMTFSVTKTFLSSTAGVAFDKGMIRNIDNAMTFNVGVKGTLDDGRWNYDATYSHSQNKLKQKWPALVAAAAAVLLKPGRGTMSINMQPNPPSTTSSAPFTYPARSLRRKRTGCAMSIGSPTRRLAVTAARAASKPGTS